MRALSRYNLLFELYGEWLLAMNKPKEALQQFEQSLEVAPGRILSMQGKDRAIKLLKNLTYGK